ncbi:Murein DD-endopeptidase MepM [Chryseobacterium aquaeductus]|uniref:Murein DD-endopeptidase MepM n=1 Tax=Chryseobacterium aquaeductus TaxID=2675056 RepID=A0A9N8MI39_9FLAO|nr:M23 family metallopeptidase [Chryseobacterium aquaeductus]CAA7332164.1 Murein DD-endopeptidase MepM [Chryseobacterium potabilaquae]CAD7814915.1 Murein DD-endopeptidase MepM [Chryseobacterium aquaeductus]
MKLKISFFILSILCFSLAKSQDLPKEQLSQFSYDRKIIYENDTIKITITNPLLCPLRVYIFSKYLKEQNVIKDSISLTIKEKSNIEYKIFAKAIDVEKIRFSIDLAFGDENKKLKKSKLALPFLKSKQYLIMQEQNGDFSHNDDYSRYAVDFKMPVGEIICAADKGFVVGVVKDYQFGGNDRKWTPYANFITIYHPQSGLFTQYVHLKQEGSFVKVGDMVKRNQPIGLSGETGYVSGAHLHFNVLVPEKNKTLISTPFSFENNVDAKNLKQNMKVKK